MRRERVGRLVVVLGIGLLVLVLVAAVRAAQTPAPSSRALAANATPPARATVSESPSAGDRAKGIEERVEVPPPPFSDGIFPCSNCHAWMEPNPTRRELADSHPDIVLAHDEEHRWCLDCHDPAQRDSLHLASGERISFEESYRLCGQCHGEKLRDWKAGVHGRRSGQWDGHKQYLLCAHCHNPHQPRFRPLAPKPPPLPPQRPQGLSKAPVTQDPGESR